jgi:hypothetical protein
LHGIFGSCSHIPGVIARLDRAIQYAEAAVVERTGRGLLDAPVKPGHDSRVCGARFALDVTAQAPASPHPALTFAQIGTT